MITANKKQSRRKFIFWGVASAAVAAALSGLSFASKKNTIACKPESKKKMVKMLTAEGKLVEVDASLITAKGKKISNKELQDWVSK
jgi:hypothetical protein